MINIKRKVKKGERRKLGIKRSSKSKEKAWAANWFCSKISISQRLRNLADPCFSPVSPLFSLRLTPILLRFFSFNFFAIPLDFDHPKTYITSKQTRIKALKSKLKHLNQNLSIEIKIKTSKKQNKKIWTS